MRFPYILVSFVIGDGWGLPSDSDPEVAVPAQRALSARPGQGPAAGGDGGSALGWMTRKSDSDGRLGSAVRMDDSDSELLRSRSA